MLHIFLSLILFVVLSSFPEAEAQPLGELNEHESWTVTAIHRLTAALDAHAEARGVYPLASPAPVEIEAIRGQLEPEFIDSIPVEDGWRGALLYWSDGDRYVVVSYGPDGQAGSTYGALPELPESGDDFVVVDGRLVSGPEHIMQMSEMGSQKRTMVDIRSIAITFEAYKIDNEALPGGATAGWVEVTAVREHVEPIYIRSLPVEDAWGNPFWIWSDGESYRIVSYGRDGERDADHSVVEPAGKSSSFDSDIVMGDGQFLQWPEGPQR
jgi:hypothetical protein